MVRLGNRQSVQILLPAAEQIGVHPDFGQANQPMGTGTMPMTNVGGREDWRPTTSHDQLHRADAHTLP